MSSDDSVLLVLSHRVDRTPSIRELADMPLPFDDEDIYAGYQVSRAIAEEYIALMHRLDELQLVFSSSRRLRSKVFLMLEEPRVGATMKEAER